MHSAGLRYSKVNGNPRIRPFGQRQVFPGRLSCEHLMLGLHQDNRRSGNEADYPRVCRWHIAGCTKGRSRARPGSVPNASARFGARVSLSGSMPGRLAGRDVDAVTYAFVARARPARAGRPGLAVQYPGRPRWRRPGHGHRPRRIRDPRRLKHARVRRNLRYPKITTSRPSSPTAGGPFPRHLAVIGDLRIQDCQHKRRFAFRSDPCHCARE